MDVELCEITDQNRDAVLALRLAAGQERFVASVRNSLRDAAEYPQANPWYRAVYAAGGPVGFVMISWNVTPQPPEIIGPWFLWRILIDERHQGRGYGAQVVRQVADLVLANGGTELLTSYVPGEGGPGGFYERLGFVPTGELDPDGEIIMRLTLPRTRGYSSADLPLYFEWHGKSPGSQPPLLLVHGGGSTIESNWGRLIPALEGTRRMLAVELQGHGRTGAGDRPASFEGSADGVAALLEELAVGPVDVLGFSNGGQVAMQLAIRHPGAVRRLVVASAPYRRDGMVDGFWDGLAAGTFADLPLPYRDADLAVSGDPAHTERMFHLDRELMLTGFTDWPDSLVASITAATLVVAADQDVVRRDHAVRLAGLIPNARLLIVPGNHGDYLGELAAAGDPGPLQRTLPFIVDFLDRSDSSTTTEVDEADAVLDALVHRFFAAVSFEAGQRPGYHTIRELFIDDGKLIRNSGEHPEITTVEQFIEPRQRSVESGELSAFEETETAEITEVFGNVAHRFSTYTKSGVLGGRPFTGAGMISTQFVRTPDGWRISSMAWDDERPGLSIPDRYR